MPTIKDLKKRLISLDPSEANFGELVRYIQNLTDLSNNDPALTSFESICHLILSKPFYFNSDEELRYYILRTQLLRWIHSRIENEEPTIDRKYRSDVIDFLEYSSCSCSPAVQEGESLVITFNYDLLLERLLKNNKNRVCRMNHSVRLNTYRDMVRDEGRSSSDLVFEYLKLHGSFDWYLAPSSDSINISNTYHVEFDDHNRELIHKGDIPVFVPMSFSKTKYLKGSLFNILWNKAVSYMDAAEQIHFIGYGFPASDNDYLELFLKYKQKVRDIVLFDKPSQKRAERIFENARVMHMHAGEYLKQKMYRI